MMIHRRRGFWPGWDIHPISAECRVTVAGHSPELNQYLIDVSRFLTESRPLTKPVNSRLLDIVSFRVSLESKTAEMLQGRRESQICCCHGSLIVVRSVLLCPVSGCAVHS